MSTASGIAIGAFTEYSTSYTETPTQNITKSGKTGPATVVIQGLGVGMIGTAVPTVIIVIAICSCNALGGLYGIAIAAVPTSELDAEARAPSITVFEGRWAGAPGS